MTAYVFYSLLLIFLGLAFVAILVAKVGLPLYRELRAGRKPAAPGTPGEWVRPEPGVIHVVGEGARAVRYVFHPATKHAPCKFAVQLECAVGGEFEVVRETGTDRFWKWIGLTVEIQTGDAGFDREYYLASDYLRFTRAAFGLPAVREAVRTLTSEGCCRIVLEEGRLQAVREHFDPDRDWTADVVPRIAVPLAALAAALPRDQAVPRMLGLLPWEVRRRAVGTVAWGSFLIGFGCLPIVLAAYPVLDSDGLAGPALGAAWAAWLTFLVVGVWLVRGGSRAHRGVVAAALGALVGFSAVSVDLALCLNAWLDSAPATSRTVPVTERWTTRTKNNTSYHLRVQGWRPERAEERLMVGYALYQQVQPKASRVVVHTQPGALGFERVTRVEAASP